MAMKDLIPWEWGKRGLSRLEEENPFSLLQRQMNSMIDDLRGGFGLQPFGGSFYPRLNVWEDEAAIHVEAELPGMTEKDVEVTLTSDFLKIRGEKKMEREERGEGNAYFSERLHGSFERSIPLRAEVNQDKVDAIFKNGILQITLHKLESEKSKVKKVSVRQE